MKTPITTHINVVACLIIGFHISAFVFGVVTVLFGSALVPAGLVTGTATGSAPFTVATTGAGVVFGSMIAAMGVFALLISLPGMLAGWGLLTRKPWARVLAIIVCILNLVAFPIGTALAVYGLLILFNPEAERLLGFPSS